MIAVGVVGLLIKADETRVNRGARASAKVAAAVTLPPHDAAAPSPKAPQETSEARTQPQ